MKNQVNAYLICCQTNLHVGNGKSDQGIIDNLVQRDHIDETPIINASSLKGALREYARIQWGEDKDKFNKIELIFGSENPAGQKKSEENQSPGKRKVVKGETIFHDAMLLALPMRSNIRPYFLATCPMILNKICDMAKIMFENSEQIEFFQNLTKMTKKLKESNVNLPCTSDGNNIRGQYFIEYADRFSSNNKVTDIMKKLFPSEDWVIFSDQEFKDLVSDYNLPVVARNYLNNGESKNLFYEQIVPRQSRFIFFVSSYANDLSKESDANNFFDELIKMGKCVQIGANGSIGYGYCVVKNVKEV
ncbi:type III-B CRISPR module RAMP protein Cmr4 [Culturomica massiliensis]|uniref:type III-B CRISPR module RAMP protein Cmr4 n=1 Tax=Culturomica massiliensis TaxID=1841857 RepID=UPI00083828B9|nr:type III-B CRISPR module RAMP protein Cmr4 [Culturomica massiliensis]